MILNTTNTGTYRVTDHPDIQRAAYNYSCVKAAHTSLQPARRRRPLAATSRAFGGCLQLGDFSASTYVLEKAFSGFQWTLGPARFRFTRLQCSNTCPQSAQPQCPKRNTQVHTKEHPS